MRYFLRGGARSAAEGPSAWLVLTEPPRGLVDLAALLVATPGLLAAPRGDGHGVLIFPGLLTGDLSTGPLRGLLCWLGYDARRWDLGRNYGPTETVLAGLTRALLRHWPAGRQVLFGPPLPLRPLYPRSAQDPR